MKLRELISILGVYSLVDVYSISNHKHYVGRINGRYNGIVSLCVQEEVLDNDVLFLDHAISKDKKDVVVDITIM